MFILFLQTIWASIIALGWIKVILALIIIGILSKMNNWLGLLALVVFLAYLGHLL